MLTPEASRLPAVDEPAAYPRYVLAPAEAAVLISLILSVTLLTWSGRPVPGVLTALCAGAATMLVPLRGICLAARPGAGSQQ